MTEPVTQSPAHRRKTAQAPMSPLMLATFLFLSSSSWSGTLLAQCPRCQTSECVRCSSLCQETRAPSSDNRHRTDDLAQSPLPIIASGLLPGSGELLRGYKIKAEAFLWFDAAAWLTYGGLSSLGNAGNQAARLFARTYSGASATQSSDAYYLALERYDNSELYNEDIRREARERYPDDRARQEDYLAQHGYFGEQAWDWGSDSLRLEYWRQRSSARNLLHAAGFAVGAIALNRLISMLDVAFFSPAPKPSQVGGSCDAGMHLTLRPSQARNTSTRPGRTRRLSALLPTGGPGIGLAYAF